MDDAGVERDSGKCKSDKGQTVSEEEIVGRIFGYASHPGE